MTADSMNIYKSMYFMDYMQFWVYALSLEHNPHVRCDSTVPICCFNQTPWCSSEANSHLDSQETRSLACSHVSTTGPYPEPFNIKFH
jgi:hypothetical protein